MWRNGLRGGGAAGASWVGTLRIIDRDYVEPSNLQRQSLFDEADAAESLPKAVAAARKIAAFNSQIVVEARVDDLIPANIESLLQGMDLILDGTDNFETRYLMNDYAIAHTKPWIYSAAVGSYAVTLNVLPGQSACLACIFPDSPRGMVETCETSGILNSAVNLVASIAVTEVLKLLVGGPQAPELRRTLLSFDLWNNEHAEISAAKPRPGCRATENAISSTSPAKGGRTSRCAAEIPCKFMSGSVPLTSRRWIGDCKATALSATMTLSSSSGTNPTR